MEIVLANWALILFWYVVGGLVFLAIDSFFIGYNGLTELNVSDFKSAIIWPLTIVSILGTTVKILVNIAKKISERINSNRGKGK